MATLNCLSVCALRIAGELHVRQRSKHQLVETIHKIWNFGRSHGRRTQHANHAEILDAAPEAMRATSVVMRKREGIAPEEPLNCDDRE